MSKYFYCVVGAALLLWAGVVGASEVSLKARAIPEDCEFVYRVETDFIFSYGNSSLSKGAQVSMVYAYEDSYLEEGNWVNPSEIALASTTGSSTWTAEYTAETFSTFQHQLFRDVNFYFLIKNPDGTVTRDPENVSGVPMVYHSMFGRQFGEKCYYDGRKSTPYLDREISRIEEPRH